MQIVCVECGTVFEGSGNSKYCCAECRAEGKAKVNHAWRHNPEVKKRRAQLRKKNAELKATEPTRAQVIAQEETPKAFISTGDYLRELEERAQGGDLRAVMLTNNNLSAEYWRAFKECEMQRCDELNKMSRCEVNGVSIYVDDFEVIVLESIKQYGIIRISR